MAEQRLVVAVDLGTDAGVMSVVLPSSADILTQRADTLASDTVIPLHRYLANLAAGDTDAVQILFAPDWMRSPDPSPVWNHLVAHRDHLLNRKNIPFLRIIRSTWRPPSQDMGGLIKSGYISLELLTSGQVTVPVPLNHRVNTLVRGNPAHHTEEVCSLLEQLDHAKVVSTLREVPDRHWMDCFVRTAYREQVLHD